MARLANARNCVIALAMPTIFAATAIVGGPTAATAPMSLDRIGFCG